MKPNKKRREHGNAIAEIAPTLFVIMMVFLFPIIDLMGLATGCVSIMLLTNEAASQAATQQSYSSSLDAICQSTASFLNNGFAKFCGAAPVGGYRNSGIDLSTRITSTNGVTNKPVGPNIPVPPPINTTENVYEYAVCSSFTFRPVIDMSNIPILGKIPGLGAPAHFRFQVNRLVEHPQGLAMGRGSERSGSGGSAPSLFDRTLVGDAGPQYNYQVWRDPDIFQKIAAAGETVVSDNVFLVQANNPNWTLSGVKTAQGQKLWIDTQAIGQWNISPTAVFTDANGFFGGIDGTVDRTVPSQPGSSLVGITGNGKPFFVGNDQTNYAPTGIGTLSMIMNDQIGHYNNNSGAQLVRVIVVQ